ncbi:DUF308 domain-containing protein [Leucobacter massiliensis]|uniref:DUF308 domain-containing protein n=1 Tax=Leucobacter massiliensis TaxID=1686285 RepID=A0A2S9QS29_9MICO|nr:DUF308 domain-containing protein [Leucobacter massiliensis]PRI12393.1 hypothetical protein B4915_01605 [Leucobacter massiliensis]
MTEATGTQSRFGDGVRTALGVGGLIAVVLGMLILLFPAKSGEITMQIVAALTAAYALAAGVVYIGSSIFSRSRGGWARVGHILLGLLYLAGGVVVMLNLGAAAAVIALFLSITIGALWVLEGIMAFTVVSESDSKVWTIVYGVISVIAGLSLILLPLLGAVTLWLLLGVAMVVMGVVQMVRALTLRPSV